MNTFEKIIKDYIESACKTDAVLAGKYEKSGKDKEGFLSSRAGCFISQNGRIV